MNLLSPTLSGFHVPSATPPGPGYSAEITALLNDTTIATLISGGSGGAAEMNVFSAHDHAAGTYTRNASNWAASLAGQLESAVAYKTWYFAKWSYGGVLITPRHVLYCEHAHPYAFGTWPFGLEVPCDLRWVLADNTVVTATQIAQTSRQSHYDGYVGQPYDLCVATIDRDVQALGVHVTPILGFTDTGDPDVIYDYGDFSVFTNLNIPTINVTQGVGRVTSSSPLPLISDYPEDHQSMYAIGRGTRTDPAEALFDYRVWDGDSGTPAFAAYDGTLYLERIILLGGGLGIQPGNHIPTINLLIAGSDAAAVARGELAEPTGLTVSPTTITP